MPRRPLAWLPITLASFLALAVCPAVGLAAEPPTVGVQPSASALIVNQTADTLTYRTPDSRHIPLPKQPRRTVVLLTSLLDLWYQAGGTAVGRCAGELNVPAEAHGLPIVGTFANPNMEKILSLEPDLVISTDVGAFRAMVPILEANGINYLLVRYVNYSDYLALIELFSTLNGNATHGRRIVDGISAQIDDCIAQIPSLPQPRVLIVFTSPNLISCELIESQTGEMVRMLGGVNIIPGSPFENNSRVNFSLERIALLDPDLILINTMGDVDACKDRLLHELAGNSAWAALRAVRRGRVHYLPKSLFLYKPNANYPQAFRYLSAILYPEAFGPPPAADLSRKDADNATAF